MSEQTQLRVLIVEDNADDRDLLLLNLQQAGFTPEAICVDTVNGIERALERADWQIVISDFDLPGFDGFRVLEVVRSWNPDVPFFLVSGVIDEEQAVAALRAGAQDYFSKRKLARLGPAVNRELREAEQRRTRLEQQQALDRDRDILRHDRIRFVDVMSHELRTPLHIINLAASMLVNYEHKMDVAARTERLLEIQAAVKRMTRIIDKVLLTSRLELHRWEVRSEVVDLRQWCEEFVANNAEDATDRARLRLSVCDLPHEVALDPKVLEIALQNLVSNALKYSAPDSPVYLEVTSDELGAMCFRVRDEGIGIPAKDISQVTSAFFRGGNVGDVQGTGLGLAIVKACVDVHKGRLEIASQQGRGTEVKIVLPDWLRAANSDAAIPIRELQVMGA